MESSRPRGFSLSSQYSVNVAALDQQHQELVRYLDKISRDLAAGQEVVTENVLARLVEYTIHHFADEEELMRKHAFPGLSAHRIEHNALTEKIASFEQDHRAGKKNVLAPLLLYMESWLKDHILKTDKEYSAFLNARGVN